MPTGQAIDVQRARTALSRAVDGFGGSRGALLLWLGSALVAGAATGWAMFQEITTFGRPAVIQTGMDFANNSWWAVRSLVSGGSIYSPAHAVIPGMGPAWLASPHVPGSLLWQAPFAALPLRAAVLAFAFVSILAIWAGIAVLVRPRGPLPVLLTACCGGFAICTGPGPGTLLLGQPTGFVLLGLALAVRARRRWLAALGFMLAASTIQLALPLGIALLVLGGWPVVWRGTTLALASSLPPVLLGIVNQGLSSFVSSFLSAGVYELHLLSGRIDLGALLQRLGVPDAAVRIGAGLLVAALAVLFLARLPAHLRRIGHPQVFCLVISFMLLCTYHQGYDMLLVSGAVIPVILVNDQSRAMQPAFGLAGVSTYFAGYNIGFIIDPLALLGIGLVSALALRRAGRPAPADPAAGTGEPALSGVRPRMTSSVAAARKETRPCP